LTDLEGLTKADFEKNFDVLRSKKDYYIVVVEDTEVKKVVSTATLFIEDKFVHKNGRVPTSFSSLFPFIFLSQPHRFEIFRFA